ncbi:TonB-dependent receptor [Sphingomonas immobilis]|uniref:TonB-dependent receptor n=1 Tax=Sphingomonas immobilis TaxID=3063997 RepID=A0ABT9A264_9SPHN|nr:TonB-dependent receptor [Sphingomonas sp. CA1-15]MDO7843633.1 TonB-dependent receptor [Sphingomonas sp. CA1-15]
MGKSDFRWVGALLLASTALGWSVPAMAQNAPDSAPATAAPDTDDIVVTAQRRSERLQDVPISVTAIEAIQLARSGIDSTAKLTQVAPALNFTQSAFAPQATIRGVGTRGVNAGDESVVPIFIDGVYQPFQLASFFDLSDVSRIEVLRGPQSTLYGRNATGGAINIITREPTADPTAELNFRYGRFNMTDLSGYVSFGSDRIATSIAGRWRRDDGYARDIISGAKLARIDNVSLHWKTVAHPTDTFTATLGVLYRNGRDNTSSAIQPINRNTTALRVDPTAVVPTEPYQSSLGFYPDIQTILTNVSLNLAWDVGPVTLHSISGYTSGIVKGTNDSDALLPLASQLRFFTYGKSLYQEIYGTATVGPVDLTVGGVYFHDASRSNPSESEARNLTTLQVTKTDTYSRLLTDSFAGYVDAKISFTKQIILILGGRYTSETKAFSTSSTSLNESTNVSTLTGPIFNHKTWSRFTPTGTLSYQPTDAVNLYFKVGKGFKSGLFNAGSLILTPVDPEDITQYEVGAKLKILRGVQLNLAGYRSNQNGVQLTARDPVTGQTFLQNAASTEITGFEAELQWRVTPAFNLRAAATGLRGKFTSFPNASVTIPSTSVNPVPATACVPGTGTAIPGNRSLICDVSGKNIIRTPFVTLNFGGDYRLDVGSGAVTFAGNIFHAGLSYWDPLNRLREPPYTQANGSITYQPAHANWHIGVWGENLTNSKNHLSIVTSGTGENQSFVRPISYGLEVGVRL